MAKLTAAQKKFLLRDTVAADGRAVSVKTYGDRVVAGNLAAVGLGKVVLGGTLFKLSEVGQAVREELICNRVSELTEHIE